MPKRVEALVEPELLVWARKKTGYSVEDAARKARVPPDKLGAWEAGSGRPTVKQLRRLGHVYGRRLAVFYLAEPPKGFPPIKDFRRAWGERRETPSPELLAEVEAAQERREVALELFEEGGEEIPVVRLRVTLDADPDAFAEGVRFALGVGVDQQFEWHHARAGFNAWREAVETLGVLALQMTTVDREEARGFSIVQRPLPAVVANNADPMVARSFTLIHELVHVALHEGGLCDLNDDARIEQFCNRVAGAVLVPAASLLEEETVREHDRGREWGDDELRRLATRYRVSREVVLRRLLILGRTDERFYNAKRKELAEEWEKREPPAEPTWGPSPATTAVVRAGPYFSRLVLSSYSHGSITASDVAGYLGVRMKHVPSIERAVLGSRE
jgi:Zn-dependent peptidase ImmA (M78 family)/transcriptional regulator with XRE-family HTH domain